MKKILCTILCAIMLLSLLPMAEAQTNETTFSRNMSKSTADIAQQGVSPRTITQVSAKVNKSDAFIGDTIRWEIYNVVGNGPFQYDFDIYLDGEPYLYDGLQWQTSGVFTYKPTLVGYYQIQVKVRENHLGGDQLDWLVPLVTLVGLRAPVIASVLAINGASLKISWNKVDGAGGYEVWRSTSKTGPFTKVKETTATTFSNGYLTAGTRYYYQILAFRKFDAYELESAFSRAVAGVPLNKTTITAVTAPSAKRLKITWANVPSATGYIVYRSLSANGTYVKVQTTTALSFTNTGLTSGKTYYYKVKPYKQFSTTNFYGPLSGYKSRKVK